MISKQEIDVISTDLNKILQNLSNKITTLEDRITVIEKQKPKTSGNRK